MQYMKLQIEFGGDINEIMIPFVGDPLVADLMVAIEQQLSVPADTQRLVFKGQNIHEFHDQPLRMFGICNSNKIRLVGRKAFIKPQ
ncbi:unnamed protein product [Brachionus calyciflorus]|uniref:Ubiquitin-like domain-containing protein n=1 Tax=Brachionus calyciflorus TaxID=104777 RepID=A0A814DLE2_9BILA|nr:unnamed protein product [Brachionus calyciflorus]